MIDKKTLQEQFINEVANVFGVDPASVTPETRFVEDLEIKSLYAAILTAALEEFSGKTFSPIEMSACATVGDAIELAVSK